MKPLFVVASLLANVGLAGILAFRPTLAPPAVHDFIVRVFPDPAKRATAAPARPVKSALPAPAPLWSKLHATDARTFVARLRAAGFPPAIIRALIWDQVSRPYDERIRALQEPDPDTPFWKMKANFFVIGDRRLEEMTQLQRERAKVLRELLSDDFFLTDDVTASQRRQFGDLPRAKIEVVQRIEDDYTEMISAVRSGAGGVLLPEDRAKLALLEREKRADLAAVLSAAELSEYEIRTSPTTAMLRTRLAGFEASEAEFRGIFQAQLMLNEKFAAGFGAVDYETRNAVQRAYQDQLRSTLGEARYADFVRETSSDFQQLSRLAQRDNLPRETALQAYQLRESAARESNRIFDDTSLTDDQKRTALLSLAQLTRSQLLATLGTSAGPEYVKISEAWLGNVERGSAVSFARQTSLVVSTDHGTMSFSGAPEYRRLPGVRPPGAR